MFRREPEQPPQGPPPSDQQIALADLPKPRLRNFRVRYTDFNTGEEQVAIISAHTITIADDNRTVFQTYVVDEVLSMMNRQPFQLQVTRVMTGVIDVEDVTPVVAESKLIQ